jgi:hypothetical protein
MRLALGVVEDRVLDAVDARGGRGLDPAEREPDPEMWKCE